MELLDSSGTNGSTNGAKAVLAKGTELHELIEKLVAFGAPVYEPAAKATSHKGYIGLVFQDCCIERFSVDDGYKYVSKEKFIRQFRGKQLTCL